MNQEDLAKAFHPHSVPKVLAELLEFEQGGESWFSNGFEFQTEEDNLSLGTYSQDPEFLNAFIVIAQADSGGSCYALWLRDNSASLEESPVVLFGGEGGVHAVASNLKEWLQLLSLDVEPMADWDMVDFFKDPDMHEPSERKEAYHEWLQSRQGVSPIEDASAILDSAAEQHQEALSELIEKYQS